MKLKFAHDEISEYASGTFHVKNGKPFEVDAVMGQELLWAKHDLNGEMVNVFERADAGKTDETPEPETPESLAKLSRKDLEKLAKDAGLDGDVYTNKLELATAIVTAKGAPKGE